MIFYTRMYLKLKLNFFFYSSRNIPTIPFQTTDLRRLYENMSEDSHVCAEVVCSFLLPENIYRHSRNYDV